MLVAPSILTANFANLKDELASINNADYIHLDIMDGHFVPNLSFGPHISNEIRKVSNVTFDTHLMVSKPLDWIDKFAIENTEFITIHYESENFLEAIKAIKKRNIKPGLSIKPKTSVSEIINYLAQVDLVLVMSVEPGFGGQKFIYDAVSKISELKQLRHDLKLNFIIEVDGGINLETAKLVKDAGADMIVAGSHIFNQVDRNKAIENLRKI